jgi:hypothetical protein
LNRLSVQEPRISGVLARPGTPLQAHSRVLRAPLSGPRQSTPWRRRSPPVPRKDGDQRVAAVSFDAVLARRPGPRRTGRSRQPAGPPGSFFPGTISSAQLTCGPDGHHCELTSNNSVAAEASGCVVDR